MTNASNKKRTDSSSSGGTWMVQHLWDRYEWKKKLYGLFGLRRKLIAKYVELNPS